MKNSNNQVNRSLWLVELTNLILQNLESDDLSNTWLASELKVSESQFFRLVKAETGKSPNKFIGDIRLKKAKEMLETETIDRVSLVAYKVGYERVGYFSDLFEKKYGVRPASLIKKNKR